MDPNVKHVTLGFNVAVCVITLVWNINWRHYSRYLTLVFPKSSKTPQKRAIRLFFAFCLVGSLWVTLEVILTSSRSMSDLGWSFLYGAIVLAVYFAIDVVLRWLRPDGR